MTSALPSHATYDHANRRLTCSVNAPDFVQNPYALYAAMHARGGRFLWEDYGFWCFANYEDVNGLLRDRRFGREVPAGSRDPGTRRHLQAFDAIERHSLLELEPPEHTRLRKLVNKAFVSSQVERFAPAIEAHANRLIDGFNGDQIDLLSRFATPIPLRVIAELMGLPPNAEQPMLDWSHAMVKLYTLTASRTQEDEANAACIAFDAFLRDAIKAKRRNPDDGLLSRMVHHDSGLTDDEIISTSVLLLNAGHEATVHQIGNAVRSILESGQDVGALFESEKAAEATVEECLRIEAPLHLFTRYAKQDVALGDDIMIRQGEQIGLLLGAANRDPASFAKPHHFMPGRPDQKNVTFGAGIHFCIGAPLARLEMAIALRVLFARMPDLALAAPAQFADSFHFHGLISLFVTNRQRATD